MFGRSVGSAAVEMKAQAVIGDTTNFAPTACDLLERLLTSRSQVFRYDRCTGLATKTRPRFAVDDPVVPVSSRKFASDRVLFLSRITRVVAS
ncbi:hypothetical protein KCP69_03715 [Salmonella enterica subsp. enterica]|nr:hypothetical protein KCP69_03715 [Salmonella enterica subsp. enterica]